MKLSKRIILSVIALFSLTGHAKHFVEIKSGDIVDSIEQPQRVIEEDGDRITVTYQFSHVLLDSISSGDGLYTISMPDFGNTYQPGLPALPARMDAIEIPIGYEPDVVIENVKYEDYFIELSTIPGYETESGETVVAPSVHQPTGFLPESAAILSSKQNYKGHNICYVNVYPVRYDSENKLVQIATELTYTVNLISGMENPHLAESIDTQLFQPELDDILLNPMSVATCGNYESDYRVSIPRDYLILSTPEFKPSISRFAEWKKAQGFTVHEVYSKVWPSDSEVKDSIDRYYSMYPGIDYLLIVGNHRHVPGMVTFNVNKHITDFYYGCLNSNHGFSELPVISRGRIAADDNERAANAFEKIIAYELCEDYITAYYFQNALHCAEFTEGNSRISGVEGRRWVKTSEEILESLREMGVSVDRDYISTCIGKPLYFAEDIRYETNRESLPDELLDEDFNWNRPNQVISDWMTSQCQYVLYRGHGTPEFWRCPGYTVTDIKNDVINHPGMLSQNMVKEYVHPIVFSICCDTGNHSENDSFAEMSLCQRYGGSSCIFAASNTSFSAFNDAMVLGMFDEILPIPVKKDYILPRPEYLSRTQSLRVGQIMDKGLFRMSEKFVSFPHQVLENDNNWNGMRATYELFHCFGDPSMFMRTEPPTCFSNAKVEIDYPTNKCRVSTGEGPAYIAFYDKNNDKVECYYSETAEFTFSQIHYGENNRLPVSYENVVIYGPNKVPYIVNHWERPYSKVEFSINGKSLTVKYQIDNSVNAYVTIVSVKTGILLNNVACNADDNAVTIDLSQFPSGDYAVAFVVNDKVVTSEVFQF